MTGSIEIRYLNGTKNFLYKISFHKFCFTNLDEPKSAYEIFPFGSRQRNVGRGFGSSKLVINSYLYRLWKNQLRRLEEILPIFHTVFYFDQLFQRLFGAWYFLDIGIHFAYYSCRNFLSFSGYSDLPKKIKDQLHFTYHFICYRVPLSENDLPAEQLVRNSWKFF